MSPDRGVKTAQTEAPRSSDSDARQHVEEEEEEEETQWTDEESEDDDPGPQFQGLLSPSLEWADPRHSHEGEESRDRDRQ